MVRRPGSGDPNSVLVREVTGVRPGRALDLGCGEGADAIWLAQQGWSVTAADISGVALGRARLHAAQAGVTGRIGWVQTDLTDGFPAGSFELVSAQFLHSPRELPRERILRDAASAVVPGGVLLVVDHAGWPSWEQDPDHEVDFPTPAGVLESLRLAERGVGGVAQRRVRADADRTRRAGGRPHGQRAQAPAADRLTG